MVHIKKITTKGFKSYGNRTISVKLSRDFTCIVGPNGSGKSNIIDAVSFVLGRLSTKSLRASVLSDLIFTGSKKMNPAKYAEVSIYLDNSDNALPFERKDVIISRSVDTSGKSVYRVNRKRETRTYVLDVLSQVGIFPEGHNIIMQGDITRFIKMSSWERRGVIEEISGIAEYNERRERGDRELAKAEDNVARVELVLNEVETQMNRLEGEKSNALRYQFIRDEIYKLKGWLYKGELEKAQKQLRETLDKIEQNKTDIQENNRTISDIISKITQKEENFDLINSEIEKLGEEKHLSITREIERLRGELNTIEQGLNFLEEQKTTLQTQKQEEEEKLQQNNLQIEKELERIERLQTEKDQQNSRIAQLKQEYQDQVSVLSETGMENLERVSRELDEKKDAFFSVEAQIDILQNDVENLQDAADEIDAEIHDLSVEENELTSQIANTESLLSEIEQKISKNAEDFNLLQKERKTLKEELSQIETDFLHKRSESIRLHSKLQAFKEDKRASPHKAVTAILEAKDKFKGVFGTISQLGQTEAEYQTALEVAAGSRIHNVVVDTTETAKKCVQYLKDLKAGRATFLPLDRMRRRSYPDIEKEGVIDYAINLVQIDPKFRPAFEDVFSDTLVVKNLDVDLKGKRLVTLEGDIFERGGAITGGHYFKRKFSSAFLISEDKEKFKKVQEELNRLKKQKAETADRLAVIKPEIQSLYDEKLKLEERVPSLQKDLERVHKEKIKISSDLQEKKEKISALTEKIQSKKQEISEYKNQKEQLSTLVTRLEEEKEEISKPLRQDELDRIETELESLRIKLQGTESERIQAESAVEHLRVDIEKIEARTADLVPRIKEIGKKIAARKEDKEKVDAELQERIKDEESFDEKIRELRKERSKIRDEEARLRQEKDTVQKKVYKCESDLNVLDNQKTQLETRIDELRDSSAQYPVEDEDTSEEKLDDYRDLKELKFKIKQLEREKERLEPINMRAVQEFEDVQLRYIELKTRVEKLYNERQSILDFIEEVESQKKTVFFEAFYNVAENFSRIFAQLSPGGSGSLILENEEDPFEGGLDVEASPKGKELKRVEAMSGGEKALTALAFVFAVQQYKPAPFYVFDEIDAHLDDENLARVADLIKDASRDTQFIVITLRDVMMAAADLLYGVSMKEQVSKIVSVELEKIAEYKEQEAVVQI